MPVSIFKKLFGTVGDVANVVVEPPDPSLYSLARINELASDLPPRKGVWWSTESAKEVVEKLPAEEIKAIEAAAEWVKDPSEETAAKVEKVLEEVDYQGPGSWAAQAAQWAAAAGAMGMSAVPAVVVGGAPAAASLVPQAVAGSVKIAAAMANGQAPSPEPERDGVPESPPDEREEDAPKETGPDQDSEENESTEDPSPEELQEQAKALKPFIDKGNEIAAMDDPWQ